MENIGRFGKLKIIGLDQGFPKRLSVLKNAKKGGGMGISYKLYKPEFLCPTIRVNLYKSRYYSTISNQSTRLGGIVIGVFFTPFSTAITAAVILELIFNLRSIALT